MLESTPDREKIPPKKLYPRIKKNFLGRPLTSLETETLVANEQFVNAGREERARTLADREAERIGDQKARKRKMELSKNEMPKIIVDPNKRPKPLDKNPY